MISPEKRTRPLLPHGLELALAGGRRRRRRAVMAGSGTTLSALAIASVFVLGSGSAPSALQVTDDPTPTTSASADPTPTAPSATTDPSGSTSSATPTEAAPSADPPSTGPSTGPTPAPGESSEPFPPESGSRPDYTESPTSSSPATECPGWSTTSATCTAGRTSSDQLPPGGKVTASLDLCVVTGSVEDVQLDYASGQEQDLEAVDSSGTVVWTFSEHVTYPQRAHSRTISRGDCLTWKLDWDGSSDDGTRVAAGTYTLRQHLTYQADTASGHTTAGAEHQVTVS